MAANMVVRTNIFALNAHRNMKNTGLEMQRASNRLASGFRINTAADDAAGLAISEAMRAQIRGLDQASRNTQDGQAMLVVTDGGMQEISNIMQRVRELTVQASNDTYTGAQRTMIALEIDELRQELVGLTERVQFNTLPLLTSQETAFFQVGPNSGHSITFNFTGISQAISTAIVGVSTAGSVVDSASNFDGSTVTEQIGTGATGGIDAAMTEVNHQRARLGAVINRMDFTMRIADINSENLSDAESRIRNADMAREMMRFTQTNVLSQAATAMLAQANQIPNNLLQLLR